jgi:hypothetical protein
MKRARTVFKRLKLTPKGLSDVSQNHDRYLVGGEMAAMKKSAIVQKTTAPARSR